MIHKEGIPLRPKLSAIGTAGYNLAKFFVSLLAKFTTNERSIKVAGGKTNLYNNNNNNNNNNNVQLKILSRLSEKFLNFKQWPLCDGEF